jgi:hypothetical protein
VIKNYGQRSSRSNKRTKEKGKGGNKKKHAIDSQNVVNTVVQRLIEK